MSSVTSSPLAVSGQQSAAGFSYKRTSLDGFLYAKKYARLTLGTAFLSVGDGHYLLLNTRNFATKWHRNM